MLLCDPPGAGENDLNGNKMQTGDQKLNGANRSMVAALTLGVPIRLSRRNDDDSSSSVYGTCLYYDGLYRVVSAACTSGERWPLLPAAPVRGCPPARARLQTPDSVRLFYRVLGGFALDSRGKLPNCQLRPARIQCWHRSHACIIGSTVAVLWRPYISAHQQRHMYIHR